MALNSSKSARSWPLKLQPPPWWAFSERIGLDIYSLACRISPGFIPPSASEKARLKWTSRLQISLTSLYFSETVAALQAFRKRHADAQRIHAQLSSQPATVDLTHYRSTLKNKAIVDDAEKLLNEFKPVTYDVNAHVKAIETFEAKAVGALALCAALLSHNTLQVSRAKETETKIDEELKQLQATLANIEEARPFEDLTVGFAST